MNARTRKMLAGAGGSEIAEAALVLPLVFMVLLGIYWFGRAFNVYATINHAAREGARYAVASTCATCSPPNNPPDINKIADQVGQAMQASGLDPKQASPPSPSVTYPACGGGGASCFTPSGAAEPAIQYCTNVQLWPPVGTPPAGGGSPVCGVSIDFQYPYQMFLPFTSLNQKPLKLSAHVQMKTEQ